MPSEAKPQPKSKCKAKEKAKRRRVRSQERPETKQEVGEEKAGQPETEQAEEPQPKEGEEEQPQEEEEDQEEEECEQGKKGRKKRTKKRHVKRRRTCRRKELTEEDRKLKVVKSYLAQCGVTWQFSQRFHNAQPVMAGDRGCKANAGFTKLQQRLVNLQPPECLTCLAMLEQCGFNNEELEKEMNGSYVCGSGNSPLKNFKFSLAAYRQKAGADSNAQTLDPKDAQIVPVEPGATDPHQENEAKELHEEAACHDFIASLPFLQLLPPSYFGKKLPVRCLLCTSASHPSGCVFEGGQLRLKMLTYLVDQHCRGANHWANVKKWQDQKDPSSQTSAPPETEQQPKVPCQGVSLTHGNMRISEYREEFVLWASHSKLSSNLAQNQYQWNLREQELILFHQNCAKIATGAVQSNRALCKACQQSAAPLAAIKNAVRYAKKHWLAIILHSRLFCSDASTAQLLDGLKATTLYKYHKTSMDEALKKSNADLQAWIRTVYAKMPKERFDKYSGCLCVFSSIKCAHQGLLPRHETLMTPGALSMHFIVKASLIIPHIMESRCFFPFFPGANQ